MHAALLVAVGVWCFLTSLAGGLVGLVLGNIRLPVILFVASSPAGAAGANIAISGIAAASAAAGHVRARRVDWGLAGRLLVPSVLGAVGGGLLAGAVPADALRIVIGASLLVFGVQTVRPPPQQVRSERAANLPATLAAATVIGFLGGLVGLILGSLRLPALLRWGGQDTRRVIGTNLVVGVAVGAAGLLGHLPGGVDWTLLAVGAAASVPGALLGSRLTGRLEPPQLLRVVGLILLVAGTAAILQGAF